MIDILYSLKENRFIDVNGVKIPAESLNVEYSSKEILPNNFEKYDFIENIKGGLALVRFNEKYGVIDKTGKEIIPCIYPSEKVDIFQEYILIETIEKERQKRLSNMTAKIQGIDSKEFPVIFTYSLNVKFNDKSVTYKLKSIKEANMIIDYLNEIVYSYEDKISIIEKQASKNIQKVLKIK